MKTSSCLTAWSAFAEQWRELGSEDCSEELGTFVNSVRRAPLISTEDLVELIHSIPITEAPPKERTLRALITCVRATQILLSEHGKKASIQAINVLFTAIERHQDMSAKSFFDALRSALQVRSEVKDSPDPSSSTTGLDYYAEHLRSAMGNKEEFEKVFRKLEADTSMKQPEVVRLANQIAFKMAKGTSKKVALQRIWELHEVSEMTSSKVRSSDGRSAA